MQPPSKNLILFMADQFPFWWDCYKSWKGLAARPPLFHPSIFPNFYGEEPRLKTSGWVLRRRKEISGAERADINLVWNLGNDSEYQEK
jgi:hypothetical protein